MWTLGMEGPTKIEEGGVLFTKPPSGRIIAHPAVLIFFLRPNTPSVQTRPGMESCMFTVSAHSKVPPAIDVISVLPYSSVWVWSQHLLRTSASVHCTVPPRTPINLLPTWRQRGLLRLGLVTTFGGTMQINTGRGLKLRLPGRLPLSSNAGTLFCISGSTNCVLGSSHLGGRGSLSSRQPPTPLLSQLPVPGSC